MNTNIPSRKQTIARVQRWLQRRSSPRLHMSTILLATALAGFFCSFLLLQLGMTRMGIRYLLATVFAYAVFLSLLRLWLEFYRKKTKQDGANWHALDLIDPNLIPTGAARVGTAGVDFGGGLSGGGGASRSFGPSSGGFAENAGGGGSKGFPLDLDVDDWLIPVLIIAAIGGAIVASIYIIVSAPVFLAEIFVDSLLVTALYKRLQKFEQKHWMETAIQRTWRPVLIVALLFVIAGYFIQKLAPEVDSIGDIWKLFISP